MSYYYVSESLLICPGASHLLSTPILKQIQPTRVRCLLLPHAPEHRQVDRVSYCYSDSSSSAVR